MKFSFFSLIIFLVPYFSFSNVTTRTIVSPRSAALGSAIHGNIGSNDTLRDNPASIAFTKNYSVEGLFINNAVDEATVLDVSVVDSKTSKIAGGFSYSKISEKNNVERDLFYVALAERYWKNAALSLAGKYVKTTQSEEKSNFYDFDLAFLIAFNKHIGLGATWKNIREQNKNFAPQEFSIGVQGAFSYFYPTFTISKLTGSDFTKLNNLIYAMGLEVVARNSFFVRSGYNIDNTKDIRKYSVGLGWRAPKISFAYAFERNIEKSSKYQHLASIRLYF